MKGNIKEGFFKIMYLFCAIFGLLAVVVITIFLLAKGMPGMMEIGFFKFLFGTNWNPSLNQFGILPMIVASLAVMAFAAIIGVGIGVFSAVFLSHFCPKRLYKVLRSLINILAGVPSVIYGFFGMKIILPAFSAISSSGVGDGLLASGIVLGIMILPTVISVSLNSLDNVPKMYYESAVSLGATHSQAVFKVVVPAAKNGIMAATILGIGRAIGETMAVKMVCGNVPNFPTSIFGSIRTLTSNIVLELSYAEGLHLDALIATGVVLFIFILIITLCLNIVTSKSQKGSGGLYSKIRALVGVNKTKGLRTGANLLKGFSVTSIVITMLSLASIVLFILIKGVPHMSLDFIFGKYTNSEDITLLPSIVTTLMMIGMTLLITVPIGVGTAIYLVEYTKKGSKFVKFVRGAVETLAGIPSIIYGLFGNLLFVVALGWGYSIIAASITLTLMILPTIIRTTEQALLEVPTSYREGSFALGAGKTRTIWKAVFPSAISGVITGIILSIGRIVGESACVLFTLGSTRTMPTGYGSSGISLAVFMYVLAGEGFHVNEAYATAVVLLIIVVIINTIASVAENAFKKKLSGIKKKGKV